MSKRGLYSSLSTKNPKKITRHYMNFLQYADGKNDLKDISKKLKLNRFIIEKIYKKLKKNNLLR